MARGTSDSNSTVGIAATATAIPTRPQRSSARLHRVSIDSISDDRNDMVIESSSPLNSNKRKQRTTTISASTRRNTTQQVEEDDNIDNKNGNDEDDIDPNDAKIEVFPFNGINYTSYQDMVNAKRERNQQVLEKSGLLSSSSALRRLTTSNTSGGRQSTTTTSGVSKRGLQAKRIKEDPTSSSRHNDSNLRRKSSRLQGVEADGLYIDEERAGRIVVAGTSIDDDRSKKSPTGASSSSNTVYITSSMNTSTKNLNAFYRNRINDGTPLSLSEAMEQAGAKWMTDTSIPDAIALAQDVLAISQLPSSPLRIDNTETTTKSPNKVKQKSVVVTSKGQYQYDPNMVKELACDDIERNVAKICPDRIYSMAVHPSTNHLIVCAGDKAGHVGIWNVIDTDSSTEDNATNAKMTEKSRNDRDGIHLFKPHTGAICALQWTGGSSSSANNLISASYDGTIRMLDVQKEQFIEVFATYDNNNDSNTKYQNRPGCGIEQDYGHKFWTQHVCMDPRFNESSCFFLSTSVGTAMHVDLRTGKDPITFHEQFSEKKVNTLSLHPNGYSLLSGGLDNTVALWDVRTLGNSLQSKRSKTPEPISYYNCGRSINSVYFSPSGKYAVSTTMANKLDIFEDIHLGAVVENGSKKSSKSNTAVQPKNSIRHDNITGRWLTTFQAIFHPQLDIFVVGSMRQPRCIELFDPTINDGNLINTVQGDGITAVVSRMVFHPRTDQMIICGGNSSGRVTIVRK